jgi:hypothetical protein
VQELIEVVPQLGPLKASIKVLVVVKLLPPAAISAISILTEAQPAGVVNVYHTSYLIPAHEPVIAELVALNRVPDVFVQLVPGVRRLGVKQSSDWANETLENKIKAINATVVRAVVGSMVFQGF